MIADPGAWNGFELAPVQRAALLPQTVDCYDQCAGIPGLGSRACLEDCLAAQGAPPPPPVHIPQLPSLPSFDDVAGLVKWVVAGVGLLVVYKLVR